MIPGDTARLAFMGLRIRPVRSALSALGVAIAVAAMVAVLSLSDASSAELISTIDRLGTNLIRVAPGQSLAGNEAVLPRSAAPMIRRIGPVDDAQAVVLVDATARRTDFVPATQTGGIAVYAAPPDLLRTLAGSMHAGRFLDPALARYPVVVLGAVAADRLGLERPGELVWLGGRWFAVAGVMDPLPLAPELDRGALIGVPAARRFLGAKAPPSLVYVRGDPDEIDAVRRVLAPTANPEHPSEVEVIRPSDALEARAAAKSAFTGLFLGLAAIALVVGGVGIANTMVISVLERRSEIGLRRSLGATAGAIARQFFLEALVLAALGGAVGTALGLAGSTALAISRGWPVVVSPVVVLAGSAAALAVGAVAGLYPAVRAARLAPAEALRAA